ncbi:hypothetical protein L1F29_07570 [Paenibacillus spongiae]|uniref:BetI-type transcriptional repressor C-terminal domain-containing protein n=1 Tax=Paenibacillus spongiae TaxID=2909671 RepID=A0ABY5SGQ3_9BACL|nr:hypothetical protein [Paenibacillus spongiae]UVI31665.1 hypothetical protein L1F29_07570 [Paenibacillus spongiae]
MRDGQDKGEFGEFDPSVMASMIQGAIGEYMMGISPITRKIDPETYCRELVKLVRQAAKQRKG